ncbi:MAG: hypothetical protein Q9217_007014, partial [Psora testacea]
ALNQAPPTPLPYSSHCSHRNTPPDTSSNHTTESGENSEQLSEEEEESRNQFFNEEEESKQKLKEAKPIFRSLDDRESSEGESGEESKWKIGEDKPIFQSFSDGESSEEESEEGDSTSEYESHHSENIMVGTPYQVRDMLRRKWFFINDNEAKSIGAALITKAERILDSKRGSDWSEDKRLQVKEGIEDHCEELEATFVANLMKHLQGDTRKIAKDREPSNAELEKEYEWIVAAWKKDHLRLRYNIDFLPDCIPQIRTGDRYYDTLVNEVPRVEKPRPDVAFGIYETAFSLLQREILNNHKCNLAGPRLYDIFFVMEAKCMNTSIEEAENQCIRSGCAMVNTRRALKKAASQPYKAAATSSSSASAPLSSSSLLPAYPKADIDSFAFTLAIGSQHAHMFVNWALEIDSNDSIQWHMHVLRVYSYRKAEDLNQLHHDMNNILDWGVSTRKTKVMEYCENIHELKVVQPKTKKQKKDEKEKEADP